MDIRINHERLKEYGYGFIEKVPGEMGSRQLLELIEYYVLTAAESGWSEDEQKNFIALACGLDDVVRKLFGTPFSVSDIIIGNENVDK